MEISRNWRLQKQRYGLVGEVCDHCGNKIFPPRDVCPSCAEEAKTSYQFSGRGEIFSFTVTTNPEYAPEKFKNQGPIVLGLIRLIEGTLITAQITDVDIVTRQDGRDEFGTPRLVFDHLETVGNRESSQKKRVDIGTEVEMVTRKLFEDGERGILVYGPKFRPILNS